MAGAVSKKKLAVPVFCCRQIPYRIVLCCPACVGLYAAFADGVRKQPPARSQASLDPFLRDVRGGRNPCTKSAESDGFPGTLQKPDFPGKLRTTRRSETEQEKALTLYAPGRSLPPAVRAVFPGLQMALFSPAPSPDDAFPSGNHDFSHWKGVSPDASRLFRSCK